MPQHVKVDSNFEFQNPEFCHVMAFAFLFEIFFEQWDISNKTNVTSFFNRKNNEIENLRFSGISDITWQNTLSLAFWGISY